MAKERISELKHRSAETSKPKCKKERANMRVTREKKTHTIQELWDNIK